MDAMAAQWIAIVVMLVVTLWKIFDKDRRISTLEQGYREEFKSLWSKYDELKQCQNDVATHIASINTTLTYIKEKIDSLSQNR